TFIHDIKSDALYMQMNGTLRELLEFPKDGMIFLEPDDEILPESMTFDMNNCTVKSNLNEHYTEMEKNVLWLKKGSEHVPIVKNRPNLTIKIPRVKKQKLIEEEAESEDEDESEEESESEEEEDTQEVLTSN
ncbi:MAG: hypothetical protein AABY22_11060, partial [Nanoarchaeota archaeon]